MGVRGGVGVGDGGVQAWRAQVVWYVRGGGGCERWWCASVECGVGVGVHGWFGVCVVG